MRSTSTDTARGSPIVWLGGPAAVCAYVLAFRVYDIADNYPMMGEQIRDWTIAQRRFAELPLIGPPSVNSGLDVGPAYYWVLWVGRVLLTPLIGPLPHTGGWVVAVFATIGDRLLLAALWRRLGSFWLATAIVVFAATAVGDASLSAVVWNPPVAETFAKLATAIVVWPGRITILRSIATLLCLLGAVQCHASGVVVAIPLFGWTLWALARERGVGSVLTVLVLAVVAVAAWALYLDMPMPAAAAVDAATRSILDSFAAIAADPLTHLRPTESAHAVSNALQLIMTAPFAVPWFGPLLLGCSAIGIVAMRSGPLLAASVAPLLTAAAVFSLWQGPLGEVYGFLVIMPAATLCLAAPVAALTGRLRHLAAIGLVALTAVLQVPRSQYIRAHYRVPAYGPLAEGIAAASRAGIPVRGISPAFTVPEGMDAAVMFSEAGGTLDPNAPVTLLIRADGTIEYLSAR